MRSVVPLVLFAAMICSAAVTPKLKWITSLEAWGNGLEQVSTPHLSKTDVFTTDTFNITVVDRATGAFKRNIDCSNKGNCLMFPGGVTVGSLFVIPKLGNLAAYESDGTVAWNVTLPCQPSAFQGIVVSEPAPDNSILVSCDASMNLTLINGLTGATITVGNSSRYESMSRAVYSVKHNIWVWSGDIGTAALAHPSLQRVWLNEQYSYASSPPIIEEKRGAVYLLADPNVIVGLDLTSGRALFSTNTWCNSGLAFVPPKWVVCNEPATVNNGHLHVYDVTSGVLTTNITLHTQCFGGVVALPRSEDLMAVAQCRNLLIANVSSGDVLSTTAIEPVRYDQPLNMGPLADGVLYCTTAASVLAVEFF